MRKQVFGRHLKRDTNERKALFKGLASSLVAYERIETTEEKAKSVKGYVEKLVTKAKMNNGAHVRSLLEPYLSPAAVVKMIDDIAPRFTDRPGGYVRIIKTRRRFSDNAKMVFMEWVEKSTVATTSSKTTKKTTARKASDEVKTTTTKPAKEKTTKKTPVKTEKKTVKTPTKKAPAKKTETKEKKK